MVSACRSGLDLEGAGHIGPSSVASSHNDAAA
jgi:hypothetical protein